MEAVSVGSDTYSLLLKDLWIYTNYTIRIYGFTVVGAGKKSNEITVSTDESSKSNLLNGPDCFVNCDERYIFKVVNCTL